MRRFETAPAALEQARQALEVRKSLLAHKRRMELSFRQLARELEVSPGALHKFLTTAYVPRSLEIREKLGLASTEVVVRIQRVKRGRDGRFQAASPEP